MFGLCVVKAKTWNGIAKRATAKGDGRCEAVKKQARKKANGEQGNEVA